MPGYDQLPSCDQLPGSDQLPVCDQLSVSYQLVCDQLPRCCGPSCDHLTGCDQSQCCDWSLCRRDCCPQRRKAEKVAQLLLTLVEEEGWEGVLSSARSPSSPVPDFCTSSDPSPSLNTLSSICWVVMCRFCRNSGNRNIDYLTPCPMERLYMEAQDGLKTISPPLFLNIFF